MNKYFWESTMVILSYGIGTMLMAFIDHGNVFSMYYIAGEMFQLSAIVLCLKACNTLDNISDTAFAIRYSLIIILFFGIYIYIYGVSGSLYLLMFIYKLLITTVIMYTILIKWNLDRKCKVSAIIIYTLSYGYLSIYDFLIYGEGDFQKKSIFVSIAIIFALLQAVEYAVLHKVQSDKNSSIQSEYLNIFAENSSDIIFYYTFKPYARFSFVSIACESVLGYKQKDFYNNNNLMVEISKEEYRNTAADIFAENDTEYQDVTIEVESKNMEKIFLQCIVNKIREGGRVVACEGVLRDVTYKIENDRKMEENNTNRNLMLSYISHDLRTPITYIIGYTEAMQKEIITSEKEKKMALESIHRNSKNLLTLVDDISLLSKLESGRFNYNYEKLTCMEMFELLEETYRPESGASLNDVNGIGNRTMNISIDGSAGDDKNVLIDIDRIEQLFNNIISNAVKATEDDGIIDMNMRVEGKHAVIAVSDNGIGIGEADIPFIFDNFYRSPQMKNRRNGSGLGLSISKQIVNGHNGEIGVESELGSGSTFTVRLPLFEP